MEVFSFNYTPLARFSKIMAVIDRFSTYKFFAQTLRKAANGLGRLVM